jgi:hypothetical protein
MHVDFADTYLAEGYQSTLSPMPSMPTGDPKEALAEFLGAEEALRAEPPDFKRALAIEGTLDDYWSDLVRLLRAYRYSKEGDAMAVSELCAEMASSIYEPFLKRRASNVTDRPAP